MVGSLRHTLQESSNNIAAVPELRWPERRERADSPRSSVLPGTLNAPHHRLNFENFPRILDARRITINSRPRSDRRYGCGPFSVCSTGMVFLFGSVLVSSFCKVTNADLPSIGKCVRQKNMRCL